VEHRVGHYDVLGMRRFLWRRATGPARPVFDAARPVVRGGTADVLCAQTFKYSLAQISACMQNYWKKRWYIYV
jgi:hypothetical protein